MFFQLQMYFGRKHIGKCLVCMRNIMYYAGNSPPPLPQHIYRFDERIQECIHVHEFCIDMLFSTIVYNIKPKYHRGESTQRYFNNMHHVENHVRFCLSPEPNFRCAITRDFVSLLYLGERSVSLVALDSFKGSVQRGNKDTIIYLESFLMTTA